MKTLVFVEAHGDKIKRGSLELLSFCKQNNLEAAAVLLSPQLKNLAAQISGYGVKEIFGCDDAKTENYNPENYGALVGEAIKKFSPQALLASASTLSKDLFPRLGARFDSGVASDCTLLECKGGDFEVRKPLYAGKCSAKVNFGTSKIKIVLMRPNQLPIVPAEAGTGSIQNLEMPAPSGKTTLKEVVKGSSEKADLTEAAIIVSGGRGMKGPEHFELLNKLADVLGATVGASRAVADAGWVPHSMQVGQTGKTVAPNLYIACGISGAIQHLAGMSGSRVIVAINKDAEAPIFQKSTYGVVGDVFEVVPPLVEEFKKALS
ncbi:MAG: electron transfer flavoprotein subunit alpha/FixB family protein [Bdellovibrionales bacterium]|nr:electron transfer flavoprotein subunit alpha/FixB family protein [Bdellovibrionales bacterium]